MISTVPLENLDSLRELVRAVPVVREIEARAVQLVLATHPERPESVPLARKFVRYGASPRGAQALILCAKVSALLDGRYHVAKDDIDAWALPALRHRLIINFEGEAEGITPERVSPKPLPCPGSDSPNSAPEPEVESRPSRGSPQANVAARERAASC